MRILSPDAVLGLFPLVYAYDKLTFTNNLQLHFVFRKNFNHAFHEAAELGRGDVRGGCRDRQAVCHNQNYVGGSVFFISFFFITHLCHAGFTVCDICLHYVCFICK